MYAVHQILTVKSCMSTNLGNLLIMTVKAQLMVIAGSLTLGNLAIVIIWLLAKQTMQEIGLPFGEI